MSSGPHLHFEARPGEFDTFARDDRINTARWMSGLMFETSTDRLKAFVEVLDLLEQTAPKAEQPLLWDGARVVVDSGRDYWDLQADGTYRMRASDIIRTAAQVDAAYGPVSVVVTGPANKVTA